MPTYYAIVRKDGQDDQLATVAIQSHMQVFGLMPFRLAKTRRGFVHDSVTCGALWFGRKRYGIHQAFSEP